MIMQNTCKSHDPSYEWNGLKGHWHKGYVPCSSVVMQMYVRHPIMLTLPLPFRWNDEPSRLFYAAHRSPETWRRPPSLPWCVLIQSNGTWWRVCRSDMTSGGGTRQTGFREAKWVTFKEAKETFFSPCFVFFFYSFQAWISLCWRSQQAARAASSTASSCLYSPFSPGCPGTSWGGWRWTCWQASLWAWPPYRRHWPMLRWPVFLCRCVCLSLSLCF